MNEDAVYKIRYRFSRSSKFQRFTGTRAEFLAHCKAKTRLDFVAEYHAEELDLIAEALDNSFARFDDDKWVLRNPTHNTDFLIVRLEPELVVTRAALDRGPSLKIVDLARVSFHNDIDKGIHQLCGMQELLEQLPKAAIAGLFQ